MSIEILQADCKRAVVKLGGLNNEELDEIISNEERIERIVNELDQVTIQSLLYIFL